MLGGCSWTCHEIQPGARDTTWRGLWLPRLLQLQLCGTTLLTFLLFMTCILKRSLKQLNNSSSNPSLETFYSVKYSSPFQAPPGPGCWACLSIAAHGGPSPSLETELLTRWPCLSRGWTRWSPEVPANLNHSVITFFLAHMQNLLTKSHSCQDMLRVSAKQVVADIKETEHVVDLGLHLIIGEKRQ